MGEPFSNARNTEKSPASLLARACSGDNARAALSRLDSKTDITLPSISYAYSSPASDDMPAGTYKAQKAPSIPPRLSFGKSTCEWSLSRVMSLRRNICDGVSQWESRTNIPYFLLGSSAFISVEPTILSTSMAGFLLKVSMEPPVRDTFRWSVTLT